MPPRQSRAFHMRHDFKPNRFGTRELALLLFSCQNQCVLSRWPGSRDLWKEERSALIEIKAEVNSQERVAYHENDD